MVRQRRFTKKAKRFVQIGLFASQSSISCFTLPQSLHSTRRISSSM
jgi:hypothetical protein